MEREEREEGKHPDWETPGGLTQWHPVKVSIVFKSRFLVDKDMLSYLIYKKMKVIFKINNNSKIIYHREFVSRALASLFVFLSN